MQSMPVTALVLGLMALPLCHNMAVGSIKPWQDAGLPNEMGVFS